MKNSLGKWIGKVINKSKMSIKSINKIFIVLLFSMLAIICFKQQIRNILITIGMSNEIINVISEAFHLTIKYFIIVVAIYMSVLLIGYVIKKIYICICKMVQHYRYSRMLKLNLIDENEKELYKSIYDYLSDENNNIPIFISGEWGVGKTYTINKFLEKYYKYSRQNIYKISCFGITTKEVLMQRISDACENEDRSVFNQVVLLIGEIPIVGAFLKKILEKKYSINNIKKNSIFIFDNYERIEWTKYEKFPGEPITNYENAITKYDIVTGIIDELVEKYKMKVIIVGNEKEMVPGYVYNTFICKLGCKIHRITPKSKIIEDVWMDILNKTVMTNSEKEEFLNILEEIREPSNTIWELERCNNIRILHKIIYNYISFILFLKENNYVFDKVINEKISIYYTNFFVNLLDYGLQSRIKKYESIGLYFEKLNFVEKNESAPCLEKINAMWCINNDERELWENLENNHCRVKINQEKLKREYKKRYISKENYKDPMLELDNISLDDMFYLLKTGEKDFRIKTMKFLDRGIVELENLNNVAKKINDFKMETVFENDEELLIKFFNYVYIKNNMSDFNGMLDRQYNSFKVCKDLYNKKISGKLVQ